MSLDRAELLESAPVFDSAPVLDEPLLSQLHGKRIGVRWVRQGQERLWFGVGTTAWDPDLGLVLRVAPDDDENGAELLLSADSWCGPIAPGAALGCDFLIQLA